MDAAHQDQLANAILSLFATVMVVGGALLTAWLAPKFAAAARWPRGQATAASILFAVGIVGAMVGANLQTFVSGFAPQVSQDPAVANWLPRGSLVCAQIGEVMAFTSLSWLMFPRLRYPPEPSAPGGTSHIKSRDIVSESLFVAVTVGFAVSSLLYWISGLALATGVGFTAFLLAFPIAFLVLSRVFRQGRTRG